MSSRHDPPSNVQITTSTGGTNISLVIDSSYSGKTYGKPSGGASRSRARSSTGDWISCHFVASDDLVGASVYKRSSLANDRTPFRLMAPPRPRLPPVGLCRRTRPLVSAALCSLMCTSMCSSSCSSGRFPHSLQDLACWGRSLYHFWTSQTKKTDPRRSIERPTRLPRPSAFPELELVSVQRVGAASVSSAVVGSTQALFWSRGKCTCLGLPYLCRRDFRAREFSWRGAPV